MIRRRRAATRYANRTVAGRALADELVDAAFEKAVVLALPRGGVPVAAEVAARLNAQLGVILVRKIGVPGRSELAMGALAMVGGEIAEFRNEEIINGLRISSEAFEAARDRERLELERRASIFPSADLDIADATVILVDDGLATGSTMLAAVAAVRTHAPAAVVVAVPVGARQAVQVLRSKADRVACLSTPEPFIAVGGAYEDFRQLSDEEVLSILKEFS
ncbi:MAG TPA: phosphoribosyltransferase family protein, partial [Propionibacteriaceae bacterium]|nr:phosphoribosyltransferase family protein [Propionibacteriaceae bacterium]